MSMRLATIHDIEMLVAITKKPRFFFIDISDLKFSKDQEIILQQAIIQDTGDMKVVQLRNTNLDPVALIARTPDPTTDQGSEETTQQARPYPDGLVLGCESSACPTQSRGIHRLQLGDWLDRQRDQQKVLLEQVNLYELQITSCNMGWDEPDELKAFVASVRRAKHLACLHLTGDNNIHYTTATAIIRAAGYSQLRSLVVEGIGEDGTELSEQTEDSEGIDQIQSAGEISTSAAEVEHRLVAEVEPGGGDALASPDESPPGMRLVHVMKAVRDAMCRSNVLRDVELGLAVSEALPVPASLLLAEGLAGSRSIRRFRMYDWNIGEEGGAAIGRSLGRNASLIALDLSRCSLGDATALAIADGLRQNCTLQFLGLSSNRISDEGGCAIVDSLIESNRGVAHLNLDHNDMGMATATEICKAIRSAAGRLNVKFRHNSGGGLCEIAEAMRGVFGTNGCSSPWDIDWAERVQAAVHASRHVASEPKIITEDALCDAITACFNLPRGGFVLDDLAMQLYTHWVLQMLAMLGTSAFLQLAEDDGDSSESSARKLASLLAMLLELYRLCVGAMCGLHQHGKVQKLPDLTCGLWGLAGLRSLRGITHARHGCVGWADIMSEYNDHLFRFRIPMLQIIGGFAEEGLIGWADGLLRRGVLTAATAAGRGSGAYSCAQARLSEVVDMLGGICAARRREIVRFRHASDARRDASMVFKAAAEGRPLELAKRLRLGKLAGGLERKGILVNETGQAQAVTPLEAARLGGHTDCIELLEGLAGLK